MKQQNFTLFLPIIMLCTIAISGTLAVTSSVNADNNPAIDDTINITVDTSCTMGQTVTSSHTTELNPGETNTTIGQSRIAAYCNDNEGYAIYAIGYTNGEYGNTNLVSTDGNHTIPTGTSGSNSYWNMKLTQGTATGATSYLPTMVNEFTSNTTIPDDYTKVAYRDSSTISQTEDPTMSGSYFTTTYAAHVSTTQPAGIYNGQVQYVMVHPSNAPAPEKPNIGQLTYMQDFATLSTNDKKSIVASMSTGQQYTLKDSRDNKDYYISKLTDGRIWMTQNLDLELDSTKTYTPADTDISTNWQPASSTIDFTGTTMSGWTNDSYSPYSASPGELYIYTSSTTADDSQYTSLAACQAAHPDCNAHNHAGNYYNWSAAVASNDTSGITASYISTPDSICPAGWRLPIARDRANTNASQEWNNLLVAEGIKIDSTINYATNGFNNIRISPLWLTRSGQVSGNTLSNVGNLGSYWTNTTMGTYNAHLLYITSNIISPFSSSNTIYGRPVRCLVK